MFRGNIDFASRTRVEGWVYCARLSLVGVRVHAFVEEECVGSGVVDLFRQDLVEAGVGDGFGGFNFSILLSEVQDPGTLHIRVEDGNAIIRQPHARLTRACGDRMDGAFVNKPQELDWMLQRGWLGKSQFRVLNALSMFGVVKQHLVEPIGENTEHESYQEFLRNTAEILELSAFASVSASVRTDFAVADFELERRRLHAAFPTSPPIIALSAQRQNTLNVVEGSHLLQAGSRETTSRGVDYDFDSNMLLWVNLDCELKYPIGGLISAVSAFVPVRTP